MALEQVASWEVQQCFVRCEVERAGKSKDEISETCLCCQKSDLEAVSNLMEAELPPIPELLDPWQKRREMSALRSGLYPACKQPRSNQRLYPAHHAVSDQSTYVGVGNGVRRHG
jgi:hypothetical protein